MRCLFGEIPKKGPGERARTGYDMGATVLRDRLRGAQTPPTHSRRPTCVEFKVKGIRDCEGPFKRSRSRDCGSRLRVHNLGFKGFDLGRLREGLGPQGSKKL